RVYFDAMETVSVRVGSTRLSIVFSDVTTGSQPSFTERKYIRTSAAKKFGMEFPVKLKKRISRSGHLLCLTAERIPSGTETAIVRSTEESIRRIVAGSFSIKVSYTSRPDT